MKVLVTSGWKTEAFCVARELGNSYLEVKTTEDIGLAAINFGFMKVPLSLEEIKKYIYDNVITHILPFDNFVFWVGQKEELLKLGAVVVANSFDACQKTTNLFEFLKTCKRNGIPTLRVFKSNNEINHLPLLLRSKDKKEIRVLHTMREVFNFTATRKDVVVQEMKIGAVLEVDFIGAWKQARIYSPDSSAFQLTTMDFPIRLLSQEAFGLKFGTLQFLLSPDGVYLTDGWPYITYSGLLCIENAADSILKQNNGEPFTVRSKFKIGERVVLCPEAVKV